MQGWTSCLSGKFQQDDELCVQKHADEKLQQAASRHKACHQGIMARGIPPVSEQWRQRRMPPAAGQPSSGLRLQPNAMR